MLVPFRPRPHRTQGDHVGEIQSADGRLADIGVGVAGQTAEPCVHRVHRFDHGREIAALDDLLDKAQLLVGKARIGVRHHNRRGDIGHAGDIGPKLLQGHVGVGCLVGRIGVDQRRRLVGQNFLEDRRDRLALCKPLPPDLGQQLGRVGLVEQDRAGRPAIGKGKPVEIVEQAGRRRGRKADDGEDAQMLGAKARFEPAGQRLIGEQRIEIDRRFRHTNAVAFGRDG